MSNGPMHYRLSDHWTEGGDVVVEVEKFHVLRETPCGYWVLSQWDWEHRDRYWAAPESKKRWVPKLGSRYCHASLEAAKDHFSLRKSREIRHIQARLDKCRHVLGQWRELKLETLETEGEVNLGMPAMGLASKFPAPTSNSN
ncbi:hypothetical protein D3C77_596620 [compost metagenome]